MSTYSVHRYYKNSTPELILTGVSIHEARVHCQQANATGDGWFDGFTEESQEAPVGIKCSVVYHDSPDGFSDVYMSFSESLLNHEGEPAEEDIYGVSDDSIFYYLSADEQTDLGKHIAEGYDKWSTDEWYIDLTEDYELVHEGAQQ